MSTADELDRLVPGLELEHRLLARPWGRQHVVLAGPPTGPAVLLVHGWPQHWAAWRGVLAALAARHRVVAVDLRAMGWSEDRTRARPTLDDHVRDLLDVCVDLGMEQPAVVGHDWGGWLAFLAAMRRPARWSQVIGVSITPPWLAPRAVLRHAPVLSYTVPMAALGDHVARRRRLVAGMLRRSAHRDPWRDEHGRAALASYQERLATPSAGRTTVGLYRGLVRKEVWAAMHRTSRVLHTPAAVVLGEEEPITRPDLFWPRTEGGGLTLRLVPEAGHWLPEEQPGTLADQLLVLLERAGEPQHAPPGEVPLAHT